MSKLTLLQSRFLDSYLRHGVGSRAVIEAGSKSKNPSVLANQWLKHPSVAAELARRQAKTSKKSELSAQVVFDELAKLVTANVKELFVEVNVTHQLKHVNSTVVMDKRPYALRITWSRRLVTAHHAR